MNELSEWFDAEDGLTVCAAWLKSDGDAEMASVFFDAPDVALLSDQVLSREYIVTYPEGVFCGLSKGDTLRVGAYSYRVRSTYAVDDGHLWHAELARIDG